MAFTFDPKAVLAHAQSRRAPHPTRPTLPKVAPGDEETVGTIGTVGRSPSSAATLTYEAIGRIGTVGLGRAANGASTPEAFADLGARTATSPTPSTLPTVAAPFDVDALAEAELLRDGFGSADRPNPGHAFDRPSAADLDAFEERAAIMEVDGGLPRANAERAAAEAQGFADAAALYAAAAGGWQRKLKALALREKSQLGRDCISAALRFIAEGWAAKAAALGWPEIELFGADPRAPWERVDRLGAAFSPFTPGAMTAECIAYPGTGARPMRRWRATLADDAVLAWEAAGG